MKTRSILNRLSLLILTLILTGCGSPSTPVVPTVSSPNTIPTAAQASYTDPFAYCTAVNTLDAPDARYTGDKLPDAVMQGFLKASEANPDAAADENFRKMTIWRCMAGQVYACNFGANLPCDSKANTDKTPTQAMNDFCQQNQNSDFIPMVVTGHTTIYNWHCLKDKPEALEQLSQVDQAGFIANIWYPIAPTP